MSETESTRRGILIRKTIVFQLKLLTDGLRDLVLVPISLFASLIGLIRGGDEPERELQQVLDFGHDTEVWINLFGRHEAHHNASSAASIDSLFTHVEEVLKQQYKSSGLSKRAQEEIDEALHTAHDKAIEQAPDK